MNTTTMKNTWMYSFKETILLALPILGAHIIEALIPFINISLAASLGETSLAAAGLVGSTFLALMGFCWGVVASVGIIAANRVGEGKEAGKIGIILWAGFITSTLLSIPVMFIFGAMDKIWLWFGQEPQVVWAAHQYMSGLLLAVPADLAKFAIFQFAIACARPRIPLIANIVSVPVLIVLNYYLIQQFGIYGVGLGTAITYWLVFAAMLAYLLVNPLFKSYLQHKHSLQAYLQIVKEQLQLGVPIGVMFSIELIFFMVLTMLMGQLGTMTLAANQIAMQWMWLTVMFVYGFTEAVTILVAKANGAQNHQQIIQFTYTGMILSTFATVIVAGIYWLYPELIIQFDLPVVGLSPEFLQLAVKLLMFCGIYQILDCMRIVIAGALRGLEDSKYPMWVAALSFWLIGLPVGYIAAFILDFKASGLWFGLMSAAAVSIVLQYFRLRQKASLESLQNTRKMVEESA